MSVNKRQREESVENEPLDLTMRIRKSPVSILYGLKKTTTTVQNEEAVKSACKKKKLAAPEDTGVKYPIDIWFLIAEYIDPENVGKFARICKDTLFVTDTAVFWSRLYKSCYVQGAFLTASRRPHTMKEPFGLRTRVIRALHSMHKPLAIKRETSLKQPVLRDRVVMRNWQQSNNKPRNPQWFYFFELRDIYYRRRWYPNSFEELKRDIAINPAEGCVVLKLTCTKRVQLPLLMGLILRDIQVFKMENRETQMKFTFTYKKEKKLNILHVEIGHIIRSGVMNWWNPRYPHLLPINTDEYEFA